MPFFIPGATPTNTPTQQKQILPFTYNYSRTDVGGDLTAQAFYAFYEYTFGGPIELMAGKSIAQGVILSSLVGTGVYGSLGGAIAFELGMDFLMIGVAATIVDPSNKWDGGLDELSRAYDKSWCDELMTSGMWNNIKFGSAVS